MKAINHEKLIFDNATFSNFARIKRLKLIFYISKNIYTTKEVIEETKKGIDTHPNLQLIINEVQAGKIEVQSLKKQQSILKIDQLKAKRSLGIGEISAMVLAEELKGIFITDDEPAAKEARRNNIRILDASNFNFKILLRNKLKATVIFLKMLERQKIISHQEFQDIKEQLKKESFCW